MANADKVVDYVSAVLSSLIPKPADILLKPVIKPVAENLKAWLGDKQTQNHYWKLRAMQRLTFENWQRKSLATIS